MLLSSRLPKKLAQAFRGKTPQKLSLRLTSEQRAHLQNLVQQVKQGVKGGRASVISKLLKPVVAQQARQRRS